MDDITNVVECWEAITKVCVFALTKICTCFKFKIVMWNKGYMLGSIHFKISQNLC